MSEVNLGKKLRGTCDSSACIRILAEALSIGDKKELGSAIWAYFGMKVEVDFDRSIPFLCFVFEAGRLPISLTFPQYDECHSDVFAAVHRFVQVLPLLRELAGRCENRPILFNLGDAAAAPGISFCDNSTTSYLIADSSFLESQGYEEVRRYFAQTYVPWLQRSRKAFWRGSTTGLMHGGLENLPRLRLCMLGRRHVDLFNFKIVGLVQLTDNQREVVEALSLQGEHVPWQDLVNHKFHIDIDGNTNSWSGLFWKLLSGGAVLKVSSPNDFKQWYYDELRPHDNFIPVKSDLSDLVEIFRHYQEHDAEAAEIGRRGRELACALTYEKEMRRSINAVVRYSSERMAMISLGLITCHGTEVYLTRDSQFVHLPSSQGTSSAFLNEWPLSDVELAQAGQGEVSLVKDGRLLCAEPNRCEMLFDRSVRGPWETFTVVVPNLLREESRHGDLF